MAALIKRHLPGVDLSDASLKKALPRVAKSPQETASVAAALREVKSRHRMVQGDARQLSQFVEGPVHLVVTSPPYWTLKEYKDETGQLGHVADYDTFVAEIAKVWRECSRILVPGGRLVIVVGDVCMSRRRHGRHVVYPLHASIQESCRKMGFDNLAPIIWHKIANADFEMGPGGFLGKPYEPNAIVKNDIEFILMLRKPGGYRSPSPAARAMSVIPAADHHKWFRQIWTLPGASTRHHPAPFPLELASRLVRMFSFVGDTVLDPFLGTGTTSVAAALAGRNSLGVEISPDYLTIASRRFLAEGNDIFGLWKLEMGEQLGPETSDVIPPRAAPTT